MLLSSSYCLVAMEAPSLDDCPFTKDIVSTYIWHCAGSKKRIHKIKWKKQIDIYGVSIRVEDAEKIKEKAPIISVTTNVLLYKKIFDELENYTTDSCDTLDPILKYRLVMAFKNNNKFETSDNKFLDAYTKYKYAIGPFYEKPTMLVGFQTDIPRKDFKELLKRHHESL